MSEPTGQHTLALELTNVSGTGCHLSGYAAITLLDTTGKTMPFDYRDAGDQVVTSLPPGNVDLAPGSIGYVTINKYRCDVGDLSKGGTVRLIPPGQAGTVGVSIPADLDFAYCGPGDPGSTVYVSPVEATFIATVQT